MIEIYRNSTEFIGLTVYSNGAYVDATDEDGNPVMPTVTLTDSDTGAFIVSGEATRDDVGRYSFLINLPYTQEERTIKAVWNFQIGAQEASKVDIVQVVTPYATPDELRSLYPDLENFTFDQLKELEKRARYIIDTVTGQSFGIRRKRKSVMLGQSVTYLEEPIVEVESVTIGGMPFDFTDTGIVIDSNGWVLRGPVKMNHFYYTSYMPELRLWKGYSLELTGLFGYRTVPMDISMAAAMLVKDYSCQEDVWRLHGLDAVKAADWRFEYGKNTYRGTGNVDVDLILSKYRSLGAAII